MEAAEVRAIAGRLAGALAADPRVQLVYLFGSAADPEAAEVRDLDLAIAGAPPFEKVLPGPVRESLRGLGGFRNLLAHDYLRLDPVEVRRHLDQAPQRFTAFALAVRRWLEAL
jgi:predicted nucleotidyltransferase